MTDQQAKLQYETPLYEGKRTLDFTPFSDALNALTDAQIAAWDDLLAEATITDIQADIKRGTLTAEALTLYYLHRIQAYDVDGFNSVIRLNPDALTIAQALDAERTDGQWRGPLHGIPVLLKDNISTGDAMPTAAGAFALRESYADRDAFITARLRDAGAIILGKANLSEWANFMTFTSVNGFSVLGGQTRNAYGRFDVGGSSAGSAVAAAQHFATVTIGSETAGSLVYPASQNSVCTFKPSFGLISQDRIIPIADAQDTAGPMTRNMLDLAITLDALAAADANDPHTQLTAALRDVEFVTMLNPEALNGQRVGVVTREEEPRPDGFAILDAVRAGLAQAGATVVDVPAMTLDYDDADIFPVLLYGYHRGVNAYLQATANPQFSTLAEIVAYNAQDLANRAPYNQTIMEAALLFDISPEMEALYADRVAHNRALALSSFRATLNAHQLDLIVDLSNYSAAIHAMAGIPALNIPAGYRATGEPLGMTIMGDWLTDPQVIAAGFAYEQAVAVRRNPVLR